MFEHLNKLHRSTKGWVTFVRFVSVSLAISIIDIVGLYSLMALGVNAYIARLCSYAASMTAGYFLNRWFTFHHVETGRRLRHSLLRHYSVTSVGGAINFGVFSLVLLIGQRMGGEVEVSAWLPFLGVWIGGMAGLCFNFFFSKKLVFDGS